MHEPKRDPERWVQDHPQAGQPFDRDVGTRTIVGFGVGIVVISVASALFIWWLFRSFEASEERADAPVSPMVERAGPSQPPQPHLQAEPERELQTFVARQDSILGSYGWVDESAGIGRISIEAAMDIVAERGLPVRSKPRSWQHPATWRDPSLLPAREVVQ